MKIIIDNKIPYIKEAVQRIADEVVYAPGKDFTPELVRDADALIVRTRTHCNRDLLESSRVRFIATATIGFEDVYKRQGCCIVQYAEKKFSRRRDTLRA